MKGRFLSLFLILTLLAASLLSCKDSVAEKEFSHCELTLVLDGSFSEERSEDFDMLVTNGDIAVSLIRISFEAGFSQGISDTYTAKNFAAFFMNKSEKSDNLLMHGDVPYYTYTENTKEHDVFYTVTFYRSYNAYFVVAYAVPEWKKDELGEKLLDYAAKAYFNDAPEIKTN